MNTSVDTTTGYESEKKESESAFRGALLASEAQYRRLFETAKDGILILDAESGKIIDVNPFLVDLLGYSKENFIDKELWEIGFFKDIAANKEKFHELQKKKYVRYDDLPLETTDGRKINVEFVSNVYWVDKKRVIQCNIRDITERKGVENALLESEMKYRAFFENSMDAILLTSPDGKTISANHSACNMFGYSEDELIKLGRSGVVDATDPRLSVILTERKLKGKAQGEATFIRKDGTHFPAEISSAIFKDHKGNDRTSMIIRDITERKHADAEISMLSHSLKSINECVSITDLNDDIIFVNESFLNTYGYDKKELIGKNITIIRSKKNELELVKEILPATISGEWQGELLNRRKDGSEFPIFLSTSVIRDKESKVLGLIGVATDISERLHAEKTLLKLSSAVEQSADAIVITDCNGTIEYVNQAFVDITGYSVKEALGNTPRILKSGTLDPRYYKEMWSTILSGKAFRKEIINKKKNGDLYYVEKTITPIFDKNKNITNFIGTEIDISERKRAEIELIASKEKAEESDHLKSAFLANMSHEIRTPLNSIIGFSELLSDTDFDKDQKKAFIKHIITNGNSLLSIISDIMDISKLESGECKIHKSQMNAHAFISNIKEQFKMQVEGKKLELKLTLPKDGEETTLFADADRLKQIFNNLISNAIKFTANGRIEIGYTLKSANPTMVDAVGKVSEPVELEFFVKDTGIGIPAEHHDNIFERFRQVESSTTRKFGGNGLGLAISKNLVELMGGKIWFESEINKGSTFYFTIPINSETIK